MLRTIYTFCLTNFLWNIAPRLVYVQRRPFACGEIHTDIMVPNWREIILTEGFRAEIEKPVAFHTFLRMRRWAKHILTGITLRQYGTCSTSYNLNIFQHCASAQKFASRSSFSSPETASIIEIRRCLYFHIYCNIARTFCGT